MNAPFPMSGEKVIEIDLADVGECARIDAFVHDAKGNLFQRPDWILAVEQGTGQKALGLALERAGAITGWLPLTQLASPLFGRALISCGFGVGGGALCVDARGVETLCRAAQEIALRRSCTAIELKDGAAPSDWARQSDSHCSFIADLADDDEAQLLAIPRKQRAEIRKSLKGTLEITIGRSEQDRAAHYATYAVSVHKLGTPVFPRALFDAMLARFGDDADILTVWNDGVPVASVLSFYHSNTVMPYWGGGTMAARHLRANERMYYALMLHARERGCKRFDFGRSKTGSGPYNYKKNWGFEPQALTYANWAAPGHEQRDIDPTSSANLVKVDMWKRLPLPIANRLGPWIARGLA